MIRTALIILMVQAVVASQPPVDANTTDVDESTTAAEASPLNPTGTATSRGLDEIFSSIDRPYDPATDPAVAGEPRLPSGTAVLLSAPNYLSDRAIRPDGPPSAGDTLYETRVLGAFRAAQGAQGRLDGRWRVAAAGGDILYVLQLADPGAGDERIEGAWRNTRTSGAGSSGFVESVSHADSGDILVKFREGSAVRPGPEVEFRFRPAADGGWIGQALLPSGPVSIVLDRDPGVEVAALAAPIYVPPQPRPAAKARPKSSRAKGKNNRRPSASSSRSKSSSRSRAPARPKAAAPKSKAPAKAPARPKAAPPKAKTPAKTPAKR